MVLRDRQNEGCQIPLRRLPLRHACWPPALSLLLSRSRKPALKLLFEDTVNIANGTVDNIVGTVSEIARNEKREITDAAGLTCTLESVQSQLSNLSPP